jgi:amino acid transporter
MEQYSQSTVSVHEEQSLFELQVDHEVTSHLGQTAKWAKFLAIVGFVVCGFILLFILIVALFVGRMASTSISPLGGAMGSSGGFMQVFLLIAMVVLYFFPCLFLLNFSNKMLLAIRNNDQNNLISSFRNLKLVFKYIGIITLVVISIYLLIFLIAMIGAATR